MRQITEVVAALSLTLGTAKGYVGVVFARLGGADRTQGVLTAVEHAPASGDLPS